MPLSQGIPFSVVLALLASQLTVTLEAPIMAIMIIGTGLWVYFDSKRLQLSRYRTGLVSPEVATIGCFGVWIIAFPWYLSARHKIANGTLPLKDPPPGA
jgi:hypothetical protein